MQLSASDLRRVFQKLRIETVECKHHVRGFLMVDGKRVLPLHYSNGRSDMWGSVAHMFRKSMHLNQGEFEDMVRCTMSREEYVQILRAKKMVR